MRSPRFWPRDRYGNRVLCRLGSSRRKPAAFFAQVLARGIAPTRRAAVSTHRRQLSVAWPPEVSHTRLVRHSNRTQELLLSRKESEVSAIPLRGPLARAFQGTVRLGLDTANLLSGPKRSAVARSR